MSSDAANTHYLHLHAEPFELIRLGMKTIESRLFDEKRQAYAVGDQLVFTNRADEGDTLTVVITNLYPAPSFEKLFAMPELQGKFSTDNPAVLLAGIGQYYSDDDQAKNGVIGIEFQLV